MECARIETYALKLKVGHCGTEPQLEAAAAPRLIWLLNEASQHVFGVALTMSSHSKPERDLACSAAVTCKPVSHGQMAETVQGWLIAAIAVPDARLGQALNFDAVMGRSRLASCLNTDHQLPPPPLPTYRHVRLRVVLQSMHSIVALTGGISRISHCAQHSETKLRSRCSLVPGSTAAASLSFSTSQYRAFIARRGAVPLSEH